MGSGQGNTQETEKTLVDRRTPHGSVQSAAAVFPSGPASSCRAVQGIWLAIVGRGHRHALCRRAKDRGHLAASRRSGAGLTCLSIIDDLGRKSSC